MAQDEVVIDGNLSLSHTIDGDASLNAQLDGIVEKVIGIKGDKGDPGPKGDKGDPGEAGPQGPKGDTGPQGPQGIQGEKGNTGATGERGPQGETGPTGLQGPKGDKGDTGATGEQGPKGETGAQGPKGDPGDDYVLTTQDKEDIAGLVNVPVTDVQVDGTSVLNNGVAVIPRASPSKPGVVRADSTYGIGLSGNLIYVYPANANQCKTAGDNRHAITPSQQHNSVFFGLAKAAGDSTQAASNNAVGTYTEEAKAAIRAMLGIPEKPAFMQKSVTLSEDSKKVIVHFGKKLKRVWINISHSSAYDAQHSMYFRLIDANGNLLANYWTQRVTSASYATSYSKAFAEVNDYGLVNLQTTGCSSDPNGYAAINTNLNFPVIDKSLFEGIELQLDTANNTAKWLTGSTFNFYAELQEGETAE